MKPAPLYLSYLGNYGMILRTLLPEESGGDVDPLDFIVLSPAVPKGTVLKALLAGVISFSLSSFHTLHRQDRACRSSLCVLDLHRNLRPLDFLPVP